MMENSGEKEQTEEGRERFEESFAGRRERQTKEVSMRIGKDRNKKRSTEEQKEKGKEETMGMTFQRIKWRKRRR